MARGWIRRKAISMTVHDVVELFRTLVGPPVPRAFSAGDCNECIRRIIPRLQRAANERKPKAKRKA